MEIAIITGFGKIDYTSSSFSYFLGIPPFALKYMKNINEGKLTPPTLLLGGISLATVLKEHGYNNISILDFYCFYKESIKILNEKKFDLIAIHSSFMEYQNIEEISQICNKTNNNAKIIIGGVEATNNRKELINENIIEYVIIGEGEETFLEIVKNIDTNKSIANIKGVYSKKGFTPREQIKNLDTLPFPDWSLMPLEKYLPTIPIETARGCPYRCIYCREHKFWQKPVRYKSTEKVIKEIKRNIQYYNIKTFRFVDSTFSNPPERILKICRNIIKENLGIKWTAYARADTLNEKLVENMAKAGCVALDIGIESGSKKILNTMIKNLTKDQITNAIKLLRKHKIITTSNFIMGFPGEDENTIKETVTFIKEIKPNTFAFHPCLLFPGSDLYLEQEQYRIHGKLADWKQEQLTSIEARKMIKELFHKEFYIPKNDSYNFYGGEVIANYFASLGLKNSEILKLYSVFNELTRYSKFRVLLNIILSAFWGGKYKIFIEIMKKLKKYNYS